MTAFDRSFDWDYAYATAPRIKDGHTYKDRWAALAADFRNQVFAAGRARLDVPYGLGERNKLDLFLPDRMPLGLAVFVHGGFWKAFDKSSWSHLAAGVLLNGWAVAMPSYSLCPDVSISEIRLEIGLAISRAAELVSGPIRLIGHSAGGHLVARMNCADTPLLGGVRERLQRTVAVCGLHDLRPLMKTAMNETLRLDPVMARAESSALSDPWPGARITCWVAGDDTPEFHRQSDILFHIWNGLVAEINRLNDTNTHHFNVVDGLLKRDSALTQELLQQN